MATTTQLPLIKLPAGRVSALFAKQIKDRATRLLVERGGMGYGLPGAERRIRLPGPMVNRLLDQIKGLEPEAEVLLKVAKMGDVKVWITAINATSNDPGCVQVDLLDPRKSR